MVTVNNSLKKSDILDYLKNIKKELQKDGVDKIGLFGSCAKEESDIFSDIDIAIKLDNHYLENRDAWSYFDLINKIKSMISKKFNRKCDLFDLDSDSYIKKEILKDINYV